jgi:segregation and condensation protein B
MTDDFNEDGRGFAGLDVRQAQAALRDEFSADDRDATMTDDQPEPPPADAARAIEWSEEDRAEHARMVEALLFAATEPLDEADIGARLPAGADVADALARLAVAYSGRGVELVRVSGRWRFATARDLAHILETEQVQPRRLSRAALETLAIIAYHQPCTRADIEDVRGVAVSKGSLDMLLEIGWVRMRGRRKDAPGRPVLYATTESFLEHFGLESVTDLPGLADLKAAGLLDARLPPGFAVPTPADLHGEVEDDEADGSDGDGTTEFSRDFLDEQDVNGA